MTPCSWRSTIILPATHVCLHVASYSASAFPCALSGPFNKLRSAGFSAPRLSVSARFVFTSASSVYNYSLLACAYLSTGSVFRQYNLKIIFKSPCAVLIIQIPSLLMQHHFFSASMPHRRSTFPKKPLSLPCIYIHKNTCRLPLYETTFNRVKNLHHSAANSLFTHSKIAPPAMNEDRTFHSAFVRVQSVLHYLYAKKYLTMLSIPLWMVLSIECAIVLASSLNVRVLAIAMISMAIEKGSVTASHIINPFNNWRISRL